MANGILIQQLSNISNKKSVTDSNGKEWRVEKNVSGFVFTCLNSSRKVPAHWTQAPQSSRLRTAQERHLPSKARTW